MQATENASSKALEPARPIAVRIREACKLTGIGRSKLYELISEGQIKAFKVGTITLISTAELDRFLNNRAADSPLRTI